MNEKDKRIVISIISIVAVIALVAGSVYAYFSFATNSGNVATTNGKLDIDYNISEPNLTGVLIPSSTRSGGVLEVATAKLNAGSIDAAINFYITPTSISGFPLSALCYDVDVLNTSNEVIDTYTGTFEDASLNSPIKIIDGYNLTTNLLTFNIYIWLDGSKINNENFNSNNSFSAMITADSVPVTGTFILPNPITDYEYEIGTGDFDGYVILKKYIGTSPTVIIPDTYTIDGNTYNVCLKIGEAGHGSTFHGNSIITDVILPSTIVTAYTAPWQQNYELRSNDITGLFSSCTSLVNAPTIPSSVTTMKSTFSDCTSLVNAPTIPSSVTSLQQTFSGCTSLVNVPTIPSSVTSLQQTFSGCTSLVNAPTIPSSVTSMDSTFFGCTSLVNAPTIPSSVTFMGSTFLGCTSLVNAPTIPSSVTSMNNTFSGCSNLEGTVRINSSNVSFSSNLYPFSSTTKNIIVEVPAGSATYTNLQNGLPANVTLTTFTS